MQTVDLEYVEQMIDRKIALFKSQLRAERADRSYRRTRTFAIAFYSTLIIAAILLNVVAAVQPD